MSKKSSITKLFSSFSRPTPEMSADSLQFYEEFPEARGKIIIVDHEGFPNGSVLIKRLQKEMEKRTPYIDKGERGEMLSRMQLLFDKGDAFAMPLRVKHDRPADLVVVVPRPRQMTALSKAKDWASCKNKKIQDFNPSIILPGCASDEEFRKFIRDHELAHAIEKIYFARNPERTNNFGENIADAYALIRHYQRTGGETSFDFFLADLRTIMPMHSYQTSHYTASILKILMEKKKDVLHLSPKESFDFAYSIAGQAETQEILEKIEKNVLQKLLAAHYSEGTKDFGKASNIQKMCAYLLDIQKHTVHEIVKSFIDDYFTSLKRVCPTVFAERKPRPF